MPLDPYRRGETWWVRGKIEYNGRAVTGYIRESTGAASEQGARDWISEREAQEHRRHVFGEQASKRPPTFADAVTLYPGIESPEMAKDLVPLTRELGHLYLTEVTPQMIRDLGPQLYPNGATDSWRRRVITPARAVINHAHDKGLCPPLRVRGYDRDERIKQDRKRGKKSRVAKTPGSWEWLLRFREHASPRHAALALFMFATGRRIGQSVAMHPGHLDLANARVQVPGAKGHDDEWITVPMEVVVDLANLRPRVPRGWASLRENLRVFGFAGRSGVMQGWRSACERAGIAYLPPHSSGRHGFGQEQVVRQGTDAKAVASYGAWSDTQMLSRTYTHAEGVEGKILEAFRTGREQAEADTGLKLLKRNV